MIPTVLGPIQAHDVEGKCSPHEYLLAKPPGMTAAMLAKVHEEPITLANFAQVRCQPESSHVSDRLLSLDESVQELADLVYIGGAKGLVLDCTSVQQGRSAAGLVEVGRRSGLHVVMAASWSEGSSVGKTSPEVIAVELEQQLLLGERITEDAGSTSITRATSSTRTSRVQAGFIAVRMKEHMNELSEGHNSHANPESFDSAILKGAMQAQEKTGAPVLIQFPGFFQNFPAVTAVLAADMDDDKAQKAVSREIVFTGMCGGIGQSIDGQMQLLEKGFVLCFDCFGRCEWSSGADFYPSDEESAVRIAALVKSGYTRQILISQGVARRIHLSRCGGFGYGHALRTVPPRLRRLGVSEDDITAMTKTNTMSLLDWYTPPPPPEIPKNYLPCSWCQTRFEPIEGEYFHKFQFIYCGIKCLRSHRDNGFKAIDH